MIRRPVAVGALTGVVCALLVLGPALAPGYLLHYDMVFVPRLHLDAQTLGIDGSFPRAVPNDIVVAVLSALVPGWVVQKVVLVAVFVGVGAGMGRVVDQLGLGRVAAVAGAVVACWNPWVAERLAIGHWGFLLGYAVLPWIVATAWSVRHGGRTTPLLTAIVLAGLTGSTGLVLALLVAVCLVPWRSAAAAWTAVTAVLVAAPWWYPAFFLADVLPGDGSGVAAFSLRSDTDFGAVGSALTGGGIWNTAAWFGERDHPVIAGVALLTAVGVVIAGSLLSPHWRRVLLAGGLGLALAITPALPGGREVVTWVVETVPGGGLWRDSQKFLAPWVLVLAIGSAVVAHRVASTAVAQPARGAAVAAVALWSVVTLPSLAWGASGTWHAVDFPADHRAVVEALAAAPEGAAAVFPWTAFRNHAWTGDRVVLDPWARLLERDVLINDDFMVDGRLVRGENARTAPISEALANGGDAATLRGVLRAAGVRFVIDLADQPGDDTVSVGRLDLTGEPFVDAGAVRVWDLGPVRGRETAPGAWIGLALGAAGCIVPAGAYGVHRVRRKPGIRA